MTQLIQAVEKLFQELVANPMGSLEVKILEQIINGNPVTHNVLLTIIATDTLVELYQALQQELSNIKPSNNP